MGNQSFYIECWLFTLVNPPPRQSATFVSTFSHLRQYLPYLKYLAMTYIIKIVTKSESVGSRFFWKS